MTKEIIGLDVSRKLPTFDPSTLPEYIISFAFGEQISGRRSGTRLLRLSVQWLLWELGEHRPGNGIVHPRRILTSTWRQLRRQSRGRRVSGKPWSVAGTSKLSEVNLTKSRVPVVLELVPLAGLCSESARCENKLKPALVINRYV